MVRSLPNDIAEEVRQDCAVALRHAKPPRSNIPRIERLAFNEALNNNDLIITKADKGNATVIMNKQDYISRMVNLLSDTNSYKVLSNNPCANILERVKAAISGSSSDVATKKCLLLNKEVTPRIYGGPKIHKPRVPLRPIVDTIDSPTYYLASFLFKLIASLAGNSNSFIKNSSHFIQFIKDKKLDNNDLLVSFDVVSLFTKVPISDSIDDVRRKSSEEIATLAELCLRSTFFSF